MLAYMIVHQELGLQLLTKIVVLQNIKWILCCNKNFALKDDKRGDYNDEITFEYVIQTNGSSVFNI